MVKKARIVLTVRLKISEWDRRNESLAEISQNIIELFLILRVFRRLCDWLLGL